MTAPTYLPDAVDAAINRQQAILNRPDVAALIEQATHLTQQQHAALDRAWADNYGLHRLAQMRAVHSLRRAFIARDGNDRTVQDIQALGELVYRRMDPPDDRWFGAAHAVYDALLILLAGDLMPEAQRSMFDSPWQSLSAGGAA